MAAHMDEMSGIFSLIQRDLNKHQQLLKPDENQLKEVQENVVSKPIEVMSVKGTKKLPNYTPVQVYNSVEKIKTRVKRAIIPADPQLKVELEVTAEMIDDVFGFNTGTRK